MFVRCCVCCLQNVVEPKAVIVREEEARAQEKAVAAKAIKDECEADLAEVRPRIRAAQLWHLIRS